MTTIDIDYLLQKDFSYYRKLPAESRGLFKSRINEFIKHTEFQGRQGLEVTETMKVLVSATAVQLTFGFNSYYNYDHFNKIILYPDKYVSKYTGQLHTGEMNTGGAIVFSWKHFYEGIKTDNDSRNVGLHEFAHALDFIDKAELGINNYFAHAIDKIKVYGRHYKHHQPEKPFFRSYAATNSTEFFAVGTEYFFEAPIEFRKEMPELYNLYCIAYRQQLQPKVVLPVQTRLRDDYMGGIKGEFSFSQLLSTLGLAFFILVHLYRWKWMEEDYPGENNQIDVEYLIVSLMSFFFVINYFIKSGIGFYSHKIRIFHPTWKSLLKMILFKNEILYTDIKLSEVLLVHIQESENDVFYTITSSYLYKNKLKHTSWKTGLIKSLNNTFQYYYNQYKIAFREDGEIKKYPIK